MRDTNVDGKVFATATQAQAFTDLFGANVDGLLYAICEGLRDRGYDVGEPKDGQVRVVSEFGFGLTVSVTP